MKKLTIERTISAPINTVWNAFTHADTLKQWWHPESMICSHASLELKPGGLFTYCFKGNDQTEYWGRGVYETITEPTFLSYRDTFCDSDGNAVPPSHYGIPGDEIIETLAEFQFQQDGEKTKITLTGENYFDDSMTDSMTQGWNQMFDNLETLVTQ